MSTEGLVLQHTTDEEEMRKQKLAAARKKLKTFRASRSSASSSQSPSPSGSSSKSRSSRSSSGSQAPPLPLTTDTTHNCLETRPPRSLTTFKSKVLPSVESPPRLRKSRSKGNLSGHRRQQSSVNGTGAHPSPARGSVFGVFDLPPVPVAPLRSPFELERREVVEPKSTTSEDESDIFRQVRGSPPSEDGEIRDRLSTFSFGSKPAARSPLPNIGQPLLPSAALSSHNSIPPASPRQAPHFATSTNTQRLSTPISRPPSLFLTQPTPLLFASPSLPGPSRSSLTAQSATTSPTSPSNAGRRRHAHTRSNSISLPNLKIGRAGQAGIPSSPSFPSSPSTPGQASESSVRPSISISGTRLKFEPSGRGAEAEREKNEYRRKALEQLTGRKATPIEPTNAEISLPDLDDEDDSSVASSIIRPLSGSFGSSSFGRSSSLTFPPLPSGWSNSTPSSLVASSFSLSSPTQDSFPVERWSGGLAAPYSEEGLSFGTFGFDSTAPKRASITTALSVLAEVDESEEVSVADGDIDEPPASEQLSNVEQTPLNDPTPSRLREFHLRSSFSATTPIRDPTVEGLRTFSFSQTSSPKFSPTSSQTPTKGYGTIGRGRPRPLSGLNGSLMSPTGCTPIAGSNAKPRSGSTSARRRALRSGSRGSSISYKKDSDAASGSSRDWSIGGKSVSSPPPVGDLGSPQASLGSPRFSGWGNMQRSAKRPCPRPQGLVGLGFDSITSNRILNEVDEVDEDVLLPAGQRGGRFTKFGFGSMADDLSAARPDVDTSRDNFLNDMQWRDRHLELEMERDALKEDVEMWRSRSERLEQKLEDEKRESAQLRDRVRKLGDRLSSVSSHAPDRSSPAPPFAESRLLAEMREQLFTLTSALDRERREKDEVSQRLANLPHARESASSPPAQQSRFCKAPPPGKLSLPPPAFLLYQPSPINSIPSPIITPATPLPDSDQSSTQYSTDPNSHRFRAWGFPSGPIEANRGKGKRESFFGLSSAVRQTSTDDDWDKDGVDLPPIAFDGDLGSLRLPRSASGPIPSSTMFVPPSIRSVSFGEPSIKARQALPPFSSTSSPSGSATAAVLALLPGHNTTSNALPVSSGSKLPRTPFPAESVMAHGVDFRGSCKCCIGEVLEL